MYVMYICMYVCMYWTERVIDVNLSCVLKNHGGRVTKNKLSSIGSSVFYKGRLIYRLCVFDASTMWWRSIGVI